MLVNLSTIGRDYSFTLVLIFCGHDSDFVFWASSVVLPF